jgi:hypothetical protein
VAGATDPGTYRLTASKLSAGTGIRYLTPEIQLDYKAKNPRRKTRSTSPPSCININSSMLPKYRGPAPVGLSWGVAQPVVPGVVGLAVRPRSPPPPRSSSYRWCCPSGFPGPPVGAVCAPVIPVGVADPLGRSRAVARAGVELVVRGPRSASTTRLRVSGEAESPVHA